MYFLLEWRNNFVANSPRASEMYENRVCFSFELGLAFGCENLAGIGSPGLYHCAIPDSFAAGGIDHIRSPR